QVVEVPRRAKVGNQSKRDEKRKLQAERPYSLSPNALAGQGDEGAAEDVAQAAVLDLGDGLRRCQPDALAEGLLGPVVADLRDVQEEDEDVASYAGLVVEVAADRVGLEQADEARLLPGFLERDFAGGLAGLEAALGDDPALAAAAADDAHLA